MPWRKEATLTPLESHHDSRTVQPAVIAAFKTSDSILGIDTVNGREARNDASAKTVIFGVFEVRNL